MPSKQEKKECHSDSMGCDTFGRRQNRGTEGNSTYQGKNRRTARTLGILPTLRRRATLWATRATGDWSDLDEQFTGSAVFRGDSASGDEPLEPTFLIYSSLVRSPPQDSMQVVNSCLVRMLPPEPVNRLR
jgi:hypothetical protein